MSEINRKNERLDLVGAFEQGWIQYRSGFFKVLPYGLLSAAPSMFFSFSVSLGAVLTILFQGFFLVLLANSVQSLATGTRDDIHSVSYLVNLFKNGLILSVFLFPLLVVSFVLFIVPSVIVFSLFMFSFFIVAKKEKFAVDALMESLRLGFGYRLHLFLFSLVFYSSIIIGVILSNVVPMLHIVINGVLVPYFFYVIFELYEQLEKK
jgi:hypothetical protein